MLDITHWVGSNPKPYIAQNVFNPFITLNLRLAIIAFAIQNIVFLHLKMLFLSLLAIVAYPVCIKP